jgi:zinc protease
MEFMFKKSRFLLALFSICLTFVLLFYGKVNANNLDNLVNNPEQTQVIAVKNTQPSSLTKDVKKTVLSNGLTVLTKEVHTAPVVTVQVWYNIGSLNEEKGVNGIAHQLEHMLFKGTKDRPVQFGRLFSALGSESNAFTSFDKTAYYGTVERNKLNTLLVLEADRMKNALINTEALDSEKKVVLSEIQGRENSPYYRLSRTVMKSAFPNHPYGLSVGGTKAEIEKFSVDKVLYYYQNYYSPNNAVLTIVGDFDTESTLKTINELFGNIPKSTIKIPNPPQLNVTNPPKSPVILKQPGSAYLMQIVYPTVSAKSVEMPPLDVLDYILTSGRSSRIYQALVETGLASNAGGGSVNLKAGGWFEFSATLAEGKKFADVDKALNKVIADVQSKGVTIEELTRAKTQLKASFILENRNIVSQAQSIANDELLLGDYAFQDKYLAAVKKVSLQDVQRVANKYLNSKKRTVGYFQPTEIKAQAGGNSSNNQTTEHFNLGTPVDPAELAKYLPEISQENIPENETLAQTITLENGFKLFLVKDSSTPTVTLNGYIQAGSGFDSMQKAGIASLTAGNMMNGTSTKDALTIAKSLENKGAGLSFGANREGVGFSGYAINTDLPKLIDILADVLKNPSFPQKELDLTKQRALIGLKQEFDSPSSLARRTLQQTIYPENHPLHPFPTESSLQSITRDDLKQFYLQNYRPEHTYLTILGNFDIDQVKSLIQTKLGDWKNTGVAPNWSNPQVDLPAKVMQINKVIAGKTQSVTLMGYQGIDRLDQRFYSALILNQILGGDTLSSRLGTEIRDRQGLTYGIYSFFQAGRYKGPFVISMQTAPQDANKAIASTVKLLQQVYTEGVTASEVRNAQRSITSSYTVDLADPDSLAGGILMNEVYGLTQAELREFPAKIKAVTPEQVNAVAKELLHPDNLIIVTAGPEVK